MGKTHIVIAGNPGVGKSFILNSLIGKINFDSDAKIGEGVTKVLQRYDGAPDYVYCDTPGLDNIDMREEAAVEISRALEGGCDMKLIFVVTLEAGRIRPADLATVRVVLKAIEDVGVATSQRYSVIVNKCSKPLMESFERMRPRAKILSTFSMVKHLGKIDYFPRIDEADDEKNYLLQENSGYVNFVEDAPTMRLPDNSNVTVDPENFDKMSEEYEEKIRDLETEINRMKKEPNDQKWLSMLLMSVPGLALGAANLLLGIQEG